MLLSISYPAPTAFCFSTTIYCQLSRTEIYFLFRGITVIYFVYETLLINIPASQSLSSDCHSSQLLEPLPLYHLKMERQVKVRYKPKQCSTDDELETAARDGDIKMLLSQVVDLKPDVMVKVCKRVLGAGVDVDLTDEHGDTALSLAAHLGHVEVCSVLIEAGADVDHANHKGSTPLFWASIRGHLNVCELLLQAGANVNHVHIWGGTALSWACHNNHLHVAKLLISHGANMFQHEKEETSPYIVMGHKYLFTMEVESFVNIEEKSKNRIFENIHELSEDKTDEEIQDILALYFFAATRNFEKCRQLLEKNTNPNLKDTGGQSALYFVCSDGDQSMVELLLEKGADANSNGCLQVSLDLQYYETAKLLLKHGCNVNKVKQVDISIELLRRNKRIFSLTKYFSSYSKTSQP